VARKSQVPFAECLAHAFVSLMPGTAIHTFLLNQAAALGTKLDVRVQVAGYDALKRLVSSGAGIAVVPRSAMSGDPDAGLKTLALEEHWAARNLRICVHRCSGPKYYRDELVRSLRAGGMEA
jgi:DNA-binding transcriptional LysR family regulator